MCAIWSCTQVERRTYGKCFPSISVNIAALLIGVVFCFTGVASAQNFAVVTQFDPFNPPTYISHPDGGYWERTGPNIDLRGVIDPNYAQQTEWSNGYGTYYLIGKVSGSYNSITSNLAYFDASFRSAGVLGSLLVSQQKYSFQTGSFNDGMSQKFLYYKHPLSALPVNGQKATLKTSQGFWLDVRARIPTYQFNYVTGCYEPTGSFYDSDKGLGLNAPVSTVEYTYHHP